MPNWIPDELRDLGAYWWLLLPLFLLFIRIIAWFSEAAKRNKGAWWVRLWNGFLTAMGWILACGLFLGGIDKTWGFTPRHLFWGLWIAVLILSIAHQHREKLREWFGSVSLFLLLLLSVPGIYGVWQDLFGFTANSLLYVLLILVLAGLALGFLHVLKRLAELQQNLRGLQTDFNIMFREEVERRRNAVGNPPIYTTEPN